MKYRIKNIERWRQLNPLVTSWMNDEVRDLDEAMASEGMGFNVIDKVNESTEAIDEVKPEIPAKVEPFTCEVCGKVCKNMLGLNSHRRSHV